MMGVLWAVMFILSLICAIFTGRIDSLSNAVSDGAKAAIELCISIGGLIILWSGVMEIMRRSGLINGISKVISPIIGLLFPQAKKSKTVMSDICTNVSANLLGLGNAATPAGIRAAAGLHRLSGERYASDDMCMLIVINTASLQLIPTTIGAIRASCGSVSPFDIIPAVWLASIISLFLGIIAAKTLAKLYRR